MQRRHQGNIKNRKKGKERVTMAKSITSNRGNGHITLIDHVIVRGALIRVQAKARSIKTAKYRLLKKKLGFFSNT